LLSGCKGTTFFPNMQIFVSLFSLLILFIKKNFAVSNKNYNFAHG